MSGDSIGPVGAIASVRHAILGLVVERPSSNDELEQRCRARFPTDDLRLTEIEAVTDELEREGWVEWTDATTDPLRSRRRRAFEATPLGVDEFEAWLEAPPAPGNTELEAFRKIGAGNWSNVDRLLEITYEHEAAALSRLTHLGVAEVFPDKVERVGLWQAVMEEIANDAGEAQIHATVHWLGRV